MHPNTKLLQQLYESLNQRKYEPMADCYHPAATFHDIAFDLHGKDQIRAMWQMICSGDISVTFEIAGTDDREGLAKSVDQYTFKPTDRRVRNPIESHFQFRDGLIISHIDSCDPRAWAAQALGGLTGFLAGRFRFLRAWKARSMLRPFFPAKTSQLASVQNGDSSRSTTHTTKAGS